MNGICNNWGDHTNLELEYCRLCRDWAEGESAAHQLQCNFVSGWVTSVRNLHIWIFKVLYDEVYMYEFSNICISSDCTPPIVTPPPKQSFTVVGELKIPDCSHSPSPSQKQNCRTLRISVPLNSCAETRFATSTSTKLRFRVECYFNMIHFAKTLVL